MEKETSCINSRAILDYLKTFDIDYTPILKNLDPDIDSLEDPESFLRNPDNWISSKVITKLFEGAIRLLGDDQAPRKMGQHVTENTKLGFTQRIVVKAFWSIKTALKQCQKINDQWNKSKRVELVKIKRNQAIVRLHWDQTMELSKHICQYNQGVYTSLPTIWGGTRLTLQEKCCYFDGAPYCEYHLKWPFRNQFHELSSRFFTSRAVLMSTIEEVERDKKTIDQQNDALRDINKELVKKVTEHRVSEEALRKSEERYRRIFENIQDVYFEMSLDGTILEISPSIEWISPYCRTDLLGEPMSTICTSPGEMDNLLNEIQKNGKATHFEVHLPAKDGSRYFCEINTSLESDGAGSPRKLIGSMRNVTERKQLETRLITAQKMESIGTLAGGIAHNFNNILMGILGSASLMRAEKDDSHPDVEPLKAIEEYVQNAAELTKDLLGFARGGKYELKPTNINELIKHENRLFGRTKKEISLHAKYAIRPWTVEVDRSQIRQALLNLYVNAGQAMPDGGDLLIQTENVTLNGKDKPVVMASGRYVKISVTDTGVGMDEAIREKVFEPFFTTREMGTGTGLGLASVYGIIKNHDGFLFVNSKKGVGTTFTIYLPASEKEVIEDKAPVPGIVKGEGTILIVDDETFITDIGKRLLEPLGYSVLTANTGQDALDLFREHKGDVDLVILDMIMPGLSGGETFDRLRVISSNLKVLLSSGYSMSTQAQEIMDRGCNGFIQKPFQLQEISAKIVELLAMT